MQPIFSRIVIPLLTLTAVLLFAFWGCSDKSSSPVDYAVPEIESLSNERPQAEERLEIYGTTFGKIKGTVTFDTIPATILIWTDTLIAVEVPHFVTNCNLTVTAENGRFDSIVVFVEHIIIRKIIPNRIVPGYVIQIVGSYFGDNIGEAFFDSLEAEIIFWTDTLIECIVPAITNSGNLTVKTDSYISNEYFFQFGWMEINSITPSKAIPGAEMTVEGKYFGHASGSVMVGLAEAEIVVWSDTLITFIVPGEAQNGKVRITSAVQTTNLIEFDLYQLSVNSISPAFGSEGTEIKIYGVYYGNESLSVYFDELEAQSTKLNDTVITAIVPDISSDANVFVQTDFETSEVLNFEYFVLNEILALLNQTDAIYVSLSSMSRSESCYGTNPTYICDTSNWNYDGTGLNSHSFSANIVWSAGGFTITYHEYTGFPEPSSEYTSLEMTGTIAEDGLSLIEITASYSKSGGTVHNHYIYIKSIKTYNIPMDSINYQNAIIIYELESVELNNKSERGEYSYSHSFPMDDNYTKLIESDLTDEENPPKAYIKFYKRD